jgi:hypothetical protein
MILLYFRIVLIFNLLWASRFAAYGSSRRAIRSITFAGFARSVVPLLSLSQNICKKFFILHSSFFILHYLHHLCDKV